MGYLIFSNDRQWPRRFVIFAITILLAIGIPVIIGSNFEITPNPQFSSLALSTLFLALGLFLSRYVNFDKEKKIMKRLLFGILYILLIIPTAEFLGWYFSLWPYMPAEENWVVVIIHAINEGIGFAYVQFFIAILYLLFIQKTEDGVFYCLNLFSFKVVFGWLFDIYINEFPTYIETFFVWFIMELGFMGIVCYNMEKYIKGKIIIKREPDLYIEADEIILGLIFIFSAAIFTLYLAFVKDVNIMHYFTTSFLSIVFGLFAIFSNKKFFHSLTISSIPIMILYFYFTFDFVSAPSAIGHLIPFILFLILVMQKKFGTFKLYMIASILISAYTSLMFSIIPGYLRFLPDFLLTNLAIFILICSITIIPAIVVKAILFFKEFYSKRGD